MKLATEASKALPEMTSRDEKHSNHDAKQRLDKICEELEFNKTTQDVAEICNVLPQGKTPYPTFTPLIQHPYFLTPPSRSQNQ